jgi:hypothetical protein
MLGLLQARSKVLVQKAKEVLAVWEDESEYDNAYERTRPSQPEVKRSREYVLWKTRVEMKEGTKAEDYELKPGNVEFIDSFSGGIQNVEMSGTAHPLSSRTRHRIRTSLSNELRALVGGSVFILEA